MVHLCERMTDKLKTILNPEAIHSQGIECLTWLSHVLDQVETGQCVGQQLYIKGCPREIRGQSVCFVTSQRPRPSLIPW